MQAHHSLKVISKSINAPSHNYPLFFSNSTYDFYFLELGMIILYVSIQFLFHFIPQSYGLFI